MWPKFAAKFDEGWMAVVRQGDRLDLAHVIRASGKPPQVRLCDSFRIEKDEADALARLAQSRGLKRFCCATLLDETDYRLVQIDAPTVPVAERVQAARWRLKDEVDFPVDNAALAVVDIPNEGTRQAHVFAVASAASRIGERMKLFGDAKVPLGRTIIPKLPVAMAPGLLKKANLGW